MKIRTLLAQGGSPRLEFKSMLQWDVRQGAKNEGLRKNVLKTIAAFLNTEGGTLVIGVEDDGRIYGLEADLKLVGNSRDRFAQHITNLLVESLGAAYAAPPLVTARFEEIDGKIVYVMDIQPAPEPVFLKGEKGREFYRQIHPIALGERENIPESWGSCSRRIRSHAQAFSHHRHPPR